MKKLIALAVMLVAFCTHAAADAAHYIYYSGNNLNPPYVWAWNGGSNCNSNGTYPGDRMEQKDGKWYWELPAGKTVPANVIICDANGNNKVSGGDMTYHDKATYKQNGSYDPYVDPNNPDDPTEPLTIYYNNSDSRWPSVNIYYWGSSGPAWPGEPMTKIEGANVYKFTFPEGVTVTGFLFCNAGGTSQTGDYNAAPTNGHEYKGSSGKGAVTDQGVFDPENPYHEEEDPDPVDVPEEFKDYSCILHLNNSSWSTPNIYVWVEGGSIVSKTWPGSEMDPINGHPGYYGWKNTKGIAPTNLIFNYQGDANKTGNLTWAEGKIWVLNGTVIGSEGTYTPNDIPVIDDPVIEPADEFKKYATVLHLEDDTWGWPYIYVWVNPSEEISASWAGDKMVHLDGVLDGKYYGWKNPTSSTPDHLIFNNNNNGKQTKNLDWTDGKVWVVKSTDDVREESTYTPEQQDPEPSSYVGAIVSVESIANGVKIVSEKGYTLLTLYGDGAVKVFQVLNSETHPERVSPSISGTPAGEFTINEADDAYEFSTSQLTVKAMKSNTGLSFSNLEGLVLVQDNNYNRSGDVYQHFLAPGTRAFYGAGYVADANVAGKTIYMNHTQTGGWPDSNSSYNHNISNPMVTSPLGFGIYFDDHFLDSSLHPAVGSLEYKSASESPVSYYFLSGGENSDMEGVMENYSAVTGRQDLPPFWTMGYITSRFGYKSRNESENVIKNIRGVNIPLDGIVLDIYWQGAPIGDAFAQAMGRLKWDEVNFPNPKEMVDNFLNGFTKDGTEVKGGVNTILITEPYFSYKGGNENCMEMRNKGYLFAEDCPNMEWIGNGALIDPTADGAIEWMNSKVYTNDDFSNIGGWWFDLGEPEHFLDNPSNKNVMHANGESHARIHNEYGLLWVQKAHEGMVQKYPDRRHMIMPRSGTSGMQRYSTFPWTGDICRSWNGLAVQIPALLSSGMSGMAYLGSDVGGFQNASGSGNIPEMYLRWVQFAAFSPQLRTHTDVPWHPQNVAEPYEAAYSGVLNEVRDAIRLRYKMLPYAYTMAYENATKGTPLARPMAFYDPDNTALFNCKDQYYWGKDILVAPVVKPNNNDYNWGGSATKRDITFPEAGTTWIDLNPGRNFRTYQGGSKVDYNAPLSVIPHFARYGSVIPTYDASKCTSTSDIDRDNIIMTVYMKGEDGDVATGYLFDDDHTSASSIESGRYNLTKVYVETRANGASFIIIETPHHGYTPAAPRRAKKASPATDDTQSLTLNFPMLNVDFPEETYSSVDGSKVVRYTDRTAFDAAPATDKTVSIYQDPTTKEAAVKFPVSRTEGINHALFMAEGILTGVSDASIGVKQLEATAYATPSGVAVRASLPEECAKARIELYDMVGTLMGTAIVTADGNSAYAEFNVGSGAYVARVSADTLSGTGVATAKVIR